MRIKISLWYVVFAIMFSCQGEVSQKESPSWPFVSHLAKGDTTLQLSKNIMVIYQDSKNNYWFGSWEDGLYKFNGSILIHYTQKDGLPSNRIEEIKEDKLGNLYFNTSQGVCKYNGSQFDVLTELTNAVNEWKLQSNDLWFKDTHGGGHVFRYDGKNLFKLKLPSTKLGDDYSSKFPTGSNPYDVYCVYKDHQGNVWFGTAVLGACRYNGKSFDWISTPDMNEIHNGPANGIRSIIDDGIGDFWFNTAFRYRMIEGDRIVKEELDTTSFYKKIRSIGSLDGLTNGELTEYLSITKDNQNALWIATYTAGVWKYDGQRVTHYSVQANGKDVTLFYIYKDRQGDIWLGTHENGTFRWNGSMFEKFSPYH